MYKKLLIILGSMLVMIAIIITITLSFRHLFLQWYIEKQFAHLCFTNSQLKVASIGYKQTHIKTIRFDSSLNDNSKITAKIPNVLLRYSFNSLKKARLKTIIIDKPYISVMLANNKHHKPKIFNFPQTLPFHQLKINQSKVIIAKLDDKKTPLILNISAKINALKNRNHCEFKIISQDFLKNPFRFDDFLTITKGQLKANGDFIWHNQQIKPLIRFNAKNICGSFHQIKIRNLNTQILIDKAFPLQSRPDQLIMIDKAKYGIEIHNIKIHFQIKSLTNNQFKLFINSITGNIANGQIMSQAIDIQTNKPKYYFDINVKNIDLSKIVNMIHQEKLHATGILNGKLPITIDTHGFTIKNGMLVSSKPGVIRFTALKESTIVKKANKSLQMTLKALSDFHYRQLKILINHNSKTNETTLSINISGKNPDFYDGHLVKFNIKLSGPFIQILRSYTPREWVLDV